MTIHRKHMKHNKLDRNRRGSLSEFLASEATAKAMPERAIRDCLEDLTVPGLTAAQITAAANAGAAGVITDAVTLTAAQKAAVSPTNLTFGEQVAAVSESRSIKFGATTGAITVTFAISGGTITRSTGSFITDGFVVGGTLAISGAADAGNNSSTPAITVVEALVLTCDAIAADETDDAGVTISCVNTIRDASGIPFALIPGFVEGATFAVSTTVANNGADYSPTSIDVLGTGAVVTDGGDPAAFTIVADTTTTLSVGAGNLDFGVLVDCLDLADEFTFDRYAGTIVSTDDSDFDTLGLVVGGIIEVKSSLQNNGRYVIRAVSTDTVTVARATTGSITVSFVLGARGTATRGSGSFLDDGFRVGDFVNIDGGAADATNRSTFEVIGVTALVLYLKDLPASESNDAGVTITTADLHDEVSESCKIVQVNTITGVIGTNIAVGSLLVSPGTALTPAFVARVSSIAAAPIYHVTGVEFDGEEDRSGTTVVFHANLILRAAGDWETDGFEAGEGIVIAAAGAGVDGGNVVFVTSDTQLYTTNPFTAAVTRDTNATVKGRALLTRGAGSWATSGFALGKLLYLQDTAGVTSGSLTIDFAAAEKTATRGSGSFVTDGFVVGDYVTIAGAADAGNNGVKLVTAVEALVLTFGEATIADESGDAGVSFVQYRANDGFYRIKKVVSTTVLEVQDTISPEVATASVDAILINEQAR